MQSGFSRSLAYLMAVALPACILLAAFSAPLIRFVYGETWFPAAATLAVLSVLGAIRVALELSYDYLAAAGRTRAILLIHVLWTTALIPALVIGANVAGIEGVGWGHVAVVVIVVIPAYLRALALTGIRPTSLVAGLVRPFVGATVMVLLSVFLSRTLQTDVLQLALGGTLSLAAYVAIVLPRRKDLVVVSDRTL
jgi:PST family polysaccharide transporter